MWSAFIKYNIPQPSLCLSINPGLGMRRGTWNLEYYQALIASCKSGNAVSAISTLVYYRALREEKCDNVLRETLGVNEDQVTGPFLRTFRL